LEEEEDRGESVVDQVAAVPLQELAAQSQECWVWGKYNILDDTRTLNIDRWPQVVALQGAWWSW